MVIVTSRSEETSLSCAFIEVRLVLETSLFGQSRAGLVGCLRKEVEVLASPVYGKALVLSSSFLG